MSVLQNYLLAQVERRLRERDGQHRNLVRGHSAQEGFDAGVRATLAALTDVFALPRPTELEEAVALEATRRANAGPHPRSRTYRAEPHGWLIEDTNASQVLGLVREALAEARSSGAAPAAVVFDLDGTLFDVSHRTLGILREWLNQQGDTRRYPRALVRRVEAIDICHIGYSLAHAFENAGLDIRDQDVADLLQAAEKFWRKRFFDGKTLVDLDRPVEGAASFVHAVANEAVHVCYLTGRDHRGMAEGTRRQLENHGFPVDDATFLLKRDHEQEDHIYKQEAFRALAERWTVVGNFENEYVNIGHMAPEAPRAVHVVLDTQHSGRPVPDLPMRIMRLADFRRT
jgi:hypothetical protein